MDGIDVSRDGDMVFLRGSGLACIFIIFFLLLLCDSLSRTILPYGASQWLGESQEQWTIPTAKLSRAPE